MTPSEARALIETGLQSGRQSAARGHVQMTGTGAA